jgi:hypothetical protein
LGRRVQGFDPAPQLYIYGSGMPTAAGFKGFSFFY